MSIELLFIAQPRLDLQSIGGGSHLWTVNLKKYCPTALQRLCGLAWDWCKLVTAGSSSRQTLESRMQASHSSQQHAGRDLVSKTFSGYKHKPGSEHLCFMNKLTITRTTVTWGGRMREIACILINIGLNSLMSHTVPVEIQIQTLFD